MDVKMLKRKQVCEMLGISDASLHRGMKAGIYPKPYRIGENSVRWRSDEIQAVIEKLEIAEPIEVCPGIRKGRRPRNAGAMEVQA